MDSNRLRVLIVEDEPAHAEAIKRVFSLSRPDDEVLLAGSLQQYRRAVADAVPDIVIMDMKLPDGNCLDIVSKSLAPPFPIVVMTSCGSEQLAVEAMKAGALDYVVKTADAFLGMPRTVERALREWRLLQQRKQAEENRARLLTAVEQMRDTVMILDTNGIIQYVNQALEALTGQPRQELIGLNMLERTSTGELHRGAWEAVLQGATWSGNITEKKKDGSSCNLDIVLTPVRDDQGAVHSVVSMGRDVTRDKQLEARLRQAQKMEAIGTLAGGIAHDFNNILSAVIGYTELSLALVPADACLASNLQEVLNAGFRARDLVKQILTFSRQSAQDKKPVRISQIVQEVLKLLRASLPATIEIRQDIGSQSIVLADPTQIHQIMMNLCTNAAHAMKEKGGVLSIALTEENLDREFVETHHGSNPGRHLKLSLSDTGCGISRELLNRIFDPFFTTKVMEEGTGLGLSVVHGIVRECSGFITVYSEPGRGSTFTIYLPLFTGSAAAAPPQQEPFPTGTEHLLIVDDEESIARLGQQILEKLGYAVDSRCSAPDALKLFTSQPSLFDLVITDMTMPKMTGDQLAGEIHRIRPDMPIILMSGYGVMLSQDNVKALGIKEVLMKPVSTRTMTETIRKVLDEARG